MENVSFCPYRTGVNWATVQTTQYSEPVTFSGQVQVQQLGPPATFTGTPSDVELLESIKEGQNAKESKFLQPKVLCSAKN